MFYTSHKFNRDIGTWNVSNVINMERMFEFAFQFNNNGSKSIESWNVSSVLSIESIFEDAQLFNQNIGKWPIRIDCNIERMFYDCAIKKETFEGFLYGNKIAEYFQLDNPNEFLVWEPYTRWERRKNAVMVFNSIFKMNINTNPFKSGKPLKSKKIDSEGSERNSILNTLHYLDDDIYKEIIYFI